MVKIRYVKKKVGDSYLVWLEENNLYYQLQEPAWFVFERLVDGKEAEKIAQEFSEQFDFDSKESQNFVEEMQIKVKELETQYDEKTEQQSLLPDLSTFKYKTYSLYNYLVGNKSIQFSFETDWLENYIHPLIKHLIAEEEKTTSTHFELFTFNNRVIFRFNSKIIGNWADNESHLTKGKIFMALLNVIYNKNDDEWLMTVHASAITNNKKTILFSAPPNSGKTTFAALLHTKGYDLISDDFVAMDHNFKAFPFPSAISVKEKALELLKPLFPELEQKELNYINEEKSVRYLPINEKSTTQIYPVKEFVFIKYDKNMEFEWKKMDTLDAIILLLEQTWVSPTFQNAKTLFDKVAESSFYQLTYSNNEKALQTIKQLFDNE